MCRSAAAHDKQGKGGQQRGGSAGLEGGRRARQSRAARQPPCHCKVLLRTATPSDMPHHCRAHTCSPPSQSTQRSSPARFRGRCWLARAERAHRTKHYASLRTLQAGRGAAQSQARQKRAEQRELLGSPSRAGWQAGWQQAAPTTVIWCTRLRTCVAGIPTWRPRLHTCVADTHMQKPCALHVPLSTRSTSTMWTLSCWEVQSPSSEKHGGVGGSCGAASSARWVTW